MIFSYDNTVSAQQRRWIEDAIAACSYPFSYLEVDVAFVVAPEPPAPGHKDYMCVQQAGPTAFTVTIREGADDPTRDFNRNIPNPPQNIRAFFRESVVHELMHVAAMVFLVTDEQRTTMASYFYRRVSGEGMTPGELADWNPLGKSWEDRIQEAVAEVMKDSFLEDSARVYDNPTNWEPFRASFDALILLVTPYFSGPVEVPMSRWSDYGFDSGYDDASLYFPFSLSDPSDLPSDHYYSGALQVTDISKLTVEVSLTFPTPSRSWVDDGPGPQLNAPSGSNITYAFGKVWRDRRSSPPPVGSGSYFNILTARNGAGVKVIDDGPGFGETAEWVLVSPDVNGGTSGEFPPGSHSFTLETSTVGPTDPDYLFDMYVSIGIDWGTTPSDNHNYGDWFWTAGAQKFENYWYGEPTQNLSVKVFLPGAVGPAPPEWPYQQPELSHRGGGAGFMRLGR